MLATLGAVACAVYAVVVAAAVAASGAARLPPAVVPRCCASGTRLDPAALDAPGLSPSTATAACVPGDESALRWTPLVYRPALGSFLERGRVPPHWTGGAAGIVSLPDCEELRAVPDHPAAYALLASNASLVLLRGATRALPPSRFCADSSAALVCAEEAPRGATKCCAEGRVYNNARCTADSERAAGALAEVLELANGTAVQAGWPACRTGSGYAVAGALKGAQLLEEGALVLAGGARLEGGAWCAEAVPGEQGAHVLTCETIARARGAGAGGAGGSPRHVLYGAGLAVGALFLAATLAAGFALPAAHHALHWRCQTHYVAALMLGDVLLAATQLAGDRVPPTLCRALGEPGCRHLVTRSRSLLT